MHKRLDLTVSGPGTGLNLPVMNITARIGRVVD